MVIGVRRGRVRPIDLLDELITVVNQVGCEAHWQRLNVPSERSQIPELNQIPRRCLIHIKQLRIDLPAISEGIQFMMGRLKRVVIFLTKQRGKFDCSDCRPCSIQRFQENVRDIGKWSGLGQESEGGGKQQVKSFLLGRGNYHIRGMALDETERSAVQVVAYAAKVHSNLAASSLVARAQIINRQYSILRERDSVRRRCARL